MQIKISPIIAEVIFHFLNKFAGASERIKDDFIYFCSEGGNEFHFGGKLGFGGKFWNNNGFYINCYSEDMTPQKAAIIEKVNKYLDYVYQLCFELED